MNKTNIDWPNLDFTWNPATGCLRGCSYCYARKIHNRFNKTPFNKIEYHYNRINEPYNVKKSSTIFVGSMSDICYWNEYFMNCVLDVCVANYEHTFMFLTKNTIVYRRYKFPSNCMIGVTVTHINDNTLEQPMSDMFQCKSYISLEPLLGNVTNYGLFCVEQYFDLIIVGAMTGPGAVKPKPEWIELLKLLPQEKTYYKNNIKKYL